jgi:hypothetical protein
MWDGCLHEDIVNKVTYWCQEGIFMVSFWGQMAQWLFLPAFLKEDKLAPGAVRDHNKHNSAKEHVCE